MQRTRMPSAMSRDVSFCTFSEFGTQPQEHILRGHGRARGPARGPKVPIAGAADVDEAAIAFANTHRCIPDVYVPWRAPLCSLSCLCATVAPGPTRALLESTELWQGLCLSPCDGQLGR